jgi:hypothetical protein
VIDDSELFDLYKNVLRMIICEDQVRALDYLEELEGDYHTFLYAKNLERLNQCGYIDNWIVVQSLAMRKLMAEIPAYMWRRTYFFSDPSWLEVRRLAKTIIVHLRP